uniref:Uncharacterized protein n=1 Tax=Calcidiscus leptoporus TaxID=127549 RepID=A0A7S0JKP6_9EUKA|mmetsp:Transcript_7481/g.17478  ORF Transcript_7481/g.17478 Transcript_7481/m.17478 type:complete len:158 (+) Transcript_7481:69-542(+)|eukprot:CAMPEP_0119379104 /NCGR_PEP_ID=MMETSP1334-20130426/51318_1 /TAXON_ID=127549 /ORGANISM="Calcidiscus leptoporus, Strain RCC1130" /LENGTH=157 /DNA_ID=CAMNT_0007398515 /DNA_START=65 /DNA_END=538 /DNA_ORIENTATION=+
MSAAAKRAAEYARQLEEIFDPICLCVQDVSDGHAAEGVKDGRALHKDGRDILILIVSSCFEGKSPLQRQQSVNAILSGDLASGLLHSVQMRCWTITQWEKKGKPQSLQPQPCALEQLSDSPTLKLAAGPSAPIQGLSLPPSTIQVVSPAAIGVCAGV